jgi:pimeloyl-ACP methyl ester carboxylesterase
MSTFVLVPGSWHAAWCWERVMPLLEAAGHRAIAPDLLGMGPDRARVASVTLADWSDQVAEVVRGHAESIILVGHSRGGAIISGTAERVPDRIQRLVYLAAFLLRDGTTLAETAAKVPQIAQSEMLELDPNGTVTVRTNMIQPIFYNMTEESWVKRAELQMSPEPLRILQTPIKVSEDRFGSIPRAYIECLRDNALPLELQRAMQADLPCDPVIALDTDHSPFFSAPDKLVAAFERIAAIT